jgi:hypothetical protein
MKESDVLNWLQDHTLGLLFSGAIGTGFAFLKKTQKAWVQPTFYGLGAFASVFAIVVGINVLNSPMLKPPDAITLENVEDHVRQWLDEYDLGVQRQKSDAAFFSFLVTLLDGYPIEITRTHDKPHYLILQGTIRVSPEHAAIIDKLPRDKAIKVMDELSLELARAKSSFRITTKTDPWKPEAITIYKGVIITPNLTADDLIRDIDEVDSNMIVASAAIRLGTAQQPKPQN